MAYRILHISDLHVGPPFLPSVADALTRQAHELRPDLVVISGDFVQRADFVAQWRGAQELRAALPQPQLVVPGNHDVPLFHAHLRLLDPLGRYRRYISADLSPVFERPGLLVVGLPTAHGLTGDGGRLAAAYAARLRATMAAAPADAVKIVTWHHPVANAPGLHRDRRMAGSAAAIRLLDECGVDMLLCGHVHVSYVGNTRDAQNNLRHGTIICQSGTSTSRRGQGPEHGRNSCNLITVNERSIDISQLRYSEEAGGFAPFAEHSFPRRGVAPARPEAESGVRVPLK